MFKGVKVRKISCSCVAVILLLRRLPAPRPTASKKRYWRGAERRTALRR
jgi:hypothetical protein